MGPVGVSWDGNGAPPRKDMGPVEVLWDGDGVALPLQCWTDTHTYENITSRRITYGNDTVIWPKQILRKLKQPVNQNVSVKQLY